MQILINNLKKIPVPKNETEKIGSNYNRGNRVIIHQHIKMYRIENIDVSSSQHSQAGYRIGCKPSYLEKKIGEVSLIFSLVMERL
jgi:hypothetical protein